MNRFLTFPRLATLFAGLFVLMIVGILLLQRIWVDPGRRCEANGGWYDIEQRICARPVYLPDITKRPAGVSRAEASDAANRELLELEAEFARQQQAVDAEIARERAAAKAASGQ